MLHKKLLILLIPAALIFVALGYWHLNSSENKKNSDAEALPFSPEQYEMVLRINSWASLLPDANLHAALRMALTKSDAAEAYKTLQFWAHVQAKETEPLYVFLNGNGIETNWLAAWKSAESNLAKPLDWQMVDSVEYGENYRFVQWRAATDKKNWYVARYRGWHLVSPNRMSMENFLRNTTIHSSNEHPELQKLLLSADAAAPINLFVNSQTAVGLFGTFVDDTTRELFRHYLGLAVFDLKWNKKNIWLSGLALSEAARELQSTDAEFEAQEVLPLSTISYNAQWHRFGPDGTCKNLSADLRDELAQYLVGEITTAQLFEPTQAGKQLGCVVLRAKSDTDAAALLSHWGNNGQHIPDTLQTASGTISLTEASAEINLCLAPAIGQVYWMQHKQFIIGGSVAALKLIADGLLRKKPLANWQAYENLQENRASGAKIELYVNPLYQKQFWPRMSKQKISSWVDSLPAHNGWLLQVVPQQNYLFLSLSSQLSESKQNRQQASWACKLDTTLANKPVFVSNHYTKEQEILVQDAANQIYLIDKTGKILWKRKLEAPIVGELSQVDRYKNGKLQLMFITSGFLYQIDRLGRDLEGFPKALPYPATAGLAVFDYDKRLDYRILVPCLDKQLYCYDIAGSPIDGWSFSGAEHEIITKIQHFVVDNRDYIVCGDKTRNYYLNRRGEERIKPTQHHGRLAGSEVFLELNPAENKPYFLSTDLHGQIFCTYTDGKVRPIQLQEFSPNHCFMYQDLNGDGTLDYIFLDNKKLLAYNQLSEEILNHQFNQVMYPALMFMNFSQHDRRLGMYSLEAHKAYLINPKGEINEPFPLPSDNLFSVGRFEVQALHFNLICGAQQRYLFNYQL